MHGVLSFPVPFPLPSATSTTATIDVKTTALAGVRKRG